MKKIILSLLAIAGIFASCSNDDIEVNTYGDIVYAVSTQSVYDDFNISEDFKEKLLSNDYNIGVYTFLYDTEGNLVVSDSTFTTTFGKIEQHFSNVPTGTYTAVTLEMLVNKNDDNVSESWYITGKESLTSLEIVNKNYIAYWYSAVGVSSSEINVDKGFNQTFEVSPKGIGSIVNVYFENFDYSNYVRASFHTKDQPRGRYLSPTYSGVDRFHYDSYNAEHVWNERGYIYYDKLPNDIGKGIYLLEEGEIKCCFGAYKADPQGGYINGFYACPNGNYRVDMKDGKTYYGLFTYVGGTEGYDCEAIIKESFSEVYEWYKSLDINFGTDAEPYLVWGSSASTVETYMKNSGMKFVEDGYDSDNTLYYSYWVNYSNTVSYEYRFETSKTNLGSLLMTYSKSKYSKTEVLNELKDKFVYDGYDETLGGDFLYTEDSSTMLLVVEYDDDIRVLYISGLSSSAAPRSKSYVGSIFNEAKSLFKSNKK